MGRIPWEAFPMLCFHDSGQRTPWHPPILQDRTIPSRHIGLPGKETQTGVETQMPFLSLGLFQAGGSRREKYRKQTSREKLDRNHRLGYCGNFQMLRFLSLEVVHGPSNKTQMVVPPAGDLSPGVLLRFPTGILGESLSLPEILLSHLTEVFLSSFPLSCPPLQHPPPNVWLSYDISRDSVYLHISIMAVTKKKKKHISCRQAHLTNPFGDRKKAQAI